LNYRGHSPFESCVRGNSRGICFHKQRTGTLFIRTHTCSTARHLYEYRANTPTLS
ncbi:hypothetical protein IRJ41_005601, partial [Triplophysa rosa]